MRDMVLLVLQPISTAGMLEHDTCTHICSILHNMHVLMFMPHYS